MPLVPPLIITVALDKASHIYFTELRNQYFPAHCNYMEAHLTFFHKLPPDIILIDQAIQKISNRKTFEMEVTGISNIGNGNVFTIASPELQQMHKILQKALDKYLITQDRKKLWPHVTIQNKVTVYKAKQTSNILLEDFKPFKIQAIGLTSWLYLKGTWQHVRDYRFNNKT